MPKLSDAQLVVLSAASQRDDRSVLPLTLKHKGAAADKVLNSLLRSSLIEECPAGLNDEVWRQADDGTRLALRATPAAFEALGIATETAAPNEPPARDNDAAPDAVVTTDAKPTKKAGAHAKKQGPTKAKSQGKSKSKPAPQAKTKVKSKGKPTPKSAAKAAAKAQKAKPAASKKPGATRDNSKQAQLIKMLERSQGASLDEIVKALEWQAHTVRGAIAGALKKKLGLDVQSEKDERRGRVYRIAA